MKKTTHPPQAVPQRSLGELDRLLATLFPSQWKARYINPEIEVINLLNSDIITNSGTETTQVENTDGIWDLNQNA